MSTQLRRIALAAVIATAIATEIVAGLGCSASEAPVAPATSSPLVGTLEGTDARVGLVVDDAKGVLYVCGGATTRASLTRWFRGPRSAAGIDWTSEDLRVIAAPRGAAWAGELRKSDGTSVPFVLDAAAAGTLAGVYDATLPTGRAGVVVFQGSPAEQASMLGAFRASGGAFAQVLPVREVSRTSRGIEVQVAGLAETIFVQPVAP